ncbi:MAG: AhpC/TSA family protein [Alistipes sp.]|nr:AhpC/TSA family protein [Alistipes sp.]
MKRLFFAAVVSLALFSCSAPKDTFILKGEISGADEGEQVTLLYPILKDGVWYEKELVTTVVEGEFLFEGELSELTFAHLVFDNMDEALLFIEPRRMKINLECDRAYDFSLQGVEVESEFEAFRRWMGEIPRSLYEERRKVVEANERWIEATQRGDLAADSLMRVFYDAVSDFHKVRDAELERCRGFLEEHLDYAIAPYWLYYLTFCEVLSVEEAMAIYDRMPSQGRDSGLGLLAKQRIELLASDVGGYEGERASDFERVAADGNRVRMSDYLSQDGYLLLDFWASWCVPCIEQMPNVRRLCEEYSERGLHIIGISSDDDATAWRRAIEKYGLTEYPQVMSKDRSEERLFFDEMADVCDRYEVESIPCFILIDGKGEIVARWQHFDEGIFEKFESLL